MGRTTMRGGAVRRVAAVLAALVALALATARAHADEVAVALLMDEPGRAEIGRELLVALAERHARVVAGDAPAGDSPIVRAAVAQKRARRLGATLAVWIEPGTRGSDLHAVTVDGDAMHRAPLPGLALELEPRVVATVAASLVDELWDDAEPAGEAAETTGTLTVELRVESPVARGPLPLGQLPPLEPVLPVWSLAVGASLLVDGASGFELRFIRRTPASPFFGAGWATLGHALGHRDWTSGACGLELGIASDPVTGFTGGIFGGLGTTGEGDARLVSLPPPGSDVHPDGSDYHAPGRGFAVAGLRGGVVLGVSRHTALRLDVSAAIEASDDGWGAVSWLSILGEVRQ